MTWVSPRVQLGVALFVEPIVNSGLVEEDGGVTIPSLGTGMSISANVQLFNRFYSIV